MPGYFKFAHPQIHLVQRQSNEEFIANQQNCTDDWLIAGCIILRTTEGSLIGGIDNGQTAHSPPQPGE